jgi:diguanylate cyclase (GGDEF)-like protein
MGIWQFNLAEQSLYWTAGVYDIFELPRQTPITREMIMEYYAPTSLKAMEAARSQAIHDCSDFSLDIEIRTAKGNGRWVRLTGAVEARNGAAHSIFGVKQDITDEKLLADKTRFLAENDVMTGLANRGRFQAYLDELRPGSVASLLLVDLDGFKQVNDTYGHAVGDACLKEAAKRLLACCPEAVLVSRIGGDEFAVLTNAACDRVESEALAQRIVTSIAEPVNCLGQALTLGASVGLAHAEGWSADDLFRHADTALYAAKAAGRNTSRVFRPS